MSKSDQTVKISKAKGRPMLQWVGKKPLTSVKAYPAQHVESFSLAAPNNALADCDRSDWSDKFPQGGLLFHGDNKDVLAYMLANGFRERIKLIYIDPPFDSAADYVRKVNLRGKNEANKVAGEEYSLGEQIQYTDIWANDNYLQFMYERLSLLKELLLEGGSIFVHCDNRKMHHLRCLLDEVFGADNFVNEIVWQHQIMGGSHDRRFPKAHETIFWYVKGDGYRLRSEDENVRVPFSEYVLKTMKKDENGKWYYERRRMSRKATEQEAANKAHTRTYIDNPEAGTVATDLWADMLSYQETPDEREGLELYPTQKTTKLLTRILAAASEPSDIVMDCFCGSGVVQKVAQKMGRRWIGCDINKGAIQTTAKRLQIVIQEQAEAAAKAKQGELIEGDDVTQKPCQFSFSTWRVNDYDLQIQHNEAVELVCEYLGVTRTRADNYFDGTLGKDLVKIIPFNHPLTPLDIEDLRGELKRRPEEERNIRLVCLGMELAAKKMIEDYNRSRPINRLHVIELRTDKQYGGIIKHEPLSASVSIKAKGEQVVVDVKDVFSPTILQRLGMQEGVFRAKIDDWRAVVDCIMVDTDYDGTVFNVKLSDIPARKQDLVNGHYELPLARKGATVAVKVIDMLGEETLVTAVV